MTDPDPIKRAVIGALGPKPTLGARLWFAARLRALADEQERIANAQGERRIAAGSVTHARSGPGRQPTRFIRVERIEDRRGRERLRLYVGKALYYAIGSPKRITIQRLGGELRISAGDEYAISSWQNTMPRVTCDGSRDLLIDVADGRYDAEVRGNQIIARI